MMWLVLLILGGTFIMAGLTFICTGIGSMLFAGGLGVAMSSVPGAEDGGLLTGVFGVGFGAIFIVVGLAMTAGGIAAVFFGLRMRRNLQSAKSDLLARGLAAEATVTFVDRNYGMLVNNRPIYSIVEFTFTDMSGMQRTAKINDASSEWVIRNKIEVGSTVTVKYLPENPARVMLVEG